MYLRIATVRKVQRTYRYAQIVESYRREDGKPTNRVLVSLGRLDDDAIARIRGVLAAARGQEVLVLPASASGRRPRVRLSLRYLDVAVLLRGWRDCGLHRLIEEALSEQPGSVDVADVVAALVLQRSIAPASKLAASRWYPTTALPELQGIAPDQFNNSRVHRALAALDAAEATLQELLPRRLAAEHGTVSAIVIDATDTWFVGKGPPLAAKGKDKEGQYRRRVGIVLLCDQRGYPLRWHTLDGRFHDATALADMAKEAARLPWARDVPLIVDRALGSAGWVEKLDALDLRYVTCVPATELESCGAPIPWDILDEMQRYDEPGVIGTKAIDAGFSRVDDERYVLDLGIFDKLRPRDAVRISQAVLAIQILAELETSKMPRLELAKQLGISEGTLRRHNALRPLVTEVRQRIIAGEADALSREQLRKVAAAPAEDQVGAFEREIEIAPQRKLCARRRRVLESLTFRARGALALNPKHLIDDRKADEDRLARVQATIEDINRRLSSPSSRRSDASALAEAQRRIRSVGLGNVCKTRITLADSGRALVLDVNKVAWERRRHSDGILLLVTHPEVGGTAAERIERYFAKDVVEKDFQTIKSLLGLRPIRHRTDSKLRAHVTICMLALLLQRLMETRLAVAGHKSTMTVVVDQLEPTRLNLIDAGKARYYTVTDPSKETVDLLGALNMRQLVDDCEVGKEIIPR